MNKNTTEGNLVIQNLRSSIEDLQAQILTDPQEGAIIQQEKPKSLLIPALIIGLLVLS